MVKGIVLLGGNIMNDTYWERYKEYRASGLSPEQAMVRAHEYMIGIV